MVTTPANKKLPVIGKRPLSEDALCCTQTGEVTQKGGGEKFYTNAAAPVSGLAPSTLTSYRIEGPRWHRDDGQRPFYYREDLIAWRDREKGGQPSERGLTGLELLIFDLLAAQLSDEQRQERQG